MTKDPFLKLHAAKTIEELLSDTDVRHNQNWLLSYLDVFVLIVMLMITLISLGNIEIEQQAIKTVAVKPVRQLPRKPHPAPKPLPTPIAKPIPPAKPEVTPAKPEIIPVQPDLLPIPPKAEVPVTDSVLLPKAAEKPPIAALPETTETVVPPPAIPQPEPAPTLTKQEKLANKLLEKLAQLGLDKRVSITITGDYAQLEIQDKILFESSKAALTGSGQSFLNDLAPLLIQSSGLIFIEGHTDNRPIKTRQFPSNWELGSARATSVLHYLSTQGLNKNRMRAMTYADTQPIADNGTAAGREKNRRVNILLKVEQADAAP